MDAQFQQRNKLKIHQAKQRLVDDTTHEYVGYLALCGEFSGSGAVTFHEEKRTAQKPSCKHCREIMEEIVRRESVKE